MTKIVYENPNQNLGMLRHFNQAFLSRLIADESISANRER
jgi:hypothetical protein